MPKPSKVSRCKAHVGILAMLRGDALANLIKIADRDAIFFPVVAQLALQRIQTIGNWHIAFDDLVTVLNEKLVERQGRQFEFLRPIVSLDNNSIPPSSLKRLKRRVLLLFELILQKFAIRRIQENAGCLRFRIVHSPQAAARCLQYHLFGTVPLLRKHNARQAAAIPPLLADLDKQDNAFLGERKIQLLKFQLRALRGLVVLVASMVLQDDFSRIHSEVFDNLCDLGIYFAFQSGNAAAVNRQLGETPVFIFRLAVLLKEFRHATTHNPKRSDVPADNRDFRLLEKIAYAADKLVVIDRVCNLFAFERKVGSQFNGRRLVKIRRTREAKNRVDSVSALCPIVYNSAQLYFVVSIALRCGMVRLVDQYRKRRNLRYCCAELVGYVCPFLVRKWNQQSAFVKRHPVQNHLFGIRHQHDAKHVSVRLEACDFLDVGVSHLI